MQRVSGAVRGGAVLLAFVAVLVAPVAYAGDFEPLQARINPPGGVASQARISPPAGAPSQEPGFFELLIDWLRAQARIQPPVG